MGIYDREYYRDATRGSGFFSGIAPACKTIILINVAVFLLQWLTQGERTVSLIEEWGAASSHEIFKQFRVWELLTSTFLHSVRDPFHIVWNMLFLWWFGREMESLYGSREFAAMYLSAAVVSTLCWAAIDYFVMDGQGHAVGASGAVTAVVVLYTLYYPRREVLLFGLLPMEMWLLTVIYVGHDVLLLLQELRHIPSRQPIAFASHVGGAAYGFLYKQLDLRWSRLLAATRRRPQFRVVMPEPRDRGPARASGSARTSAPGTVPPRPAPSTYIPEEQLDERLDEVLAKIAREGRGSLTEEEQRVLQEASRRARDRRSDRH